MQEKISSNTQKIEAKATLELLGQAINAVNKGTNKGVHNTQNREETIKTLLLEYIVFSDLLDNYHPINNKKMKSNNLPLFKNATKETIQETLKVSNNIANEIIKLRIRQESITADDLLTITGIGQKTVEKAKKYFEFEEI